MTKYKSNCGHHGPVDQVPPNAGIGRYIQRWYQQSRGQDRAVHWPDTFDLNVPAQGDGYDFTVTVHFTWCVTGKTDAESLVVRAMDQRTTLLEQVALKIRTVSRLYPPYEAAEAEARVHQAIGEVFARTRLTFASPAGVDGDARAIDHRTILRLDKPVREAQRTAWSLRQEAVNEHGLARLLADQLTERRRMWRDFIRDGEGDWRTPYAVALAKDPARAAEIVEKMAADRRAYVRELADLVVDQSKQYATQDVFETMTQNETVLWQLMKLLNVPNLPSVEPSPFDDDFPD
jgi:hypothetical protein